MLAALLVASQVLYVANTTTFGCTSTEEVAKLQQIRAGRQAFQKELIEQVFEGQCVEITKGKVVEGAIEPSDSSILRVDRTIEPPGFVAPAHDFDKLKPGNGSKDGSK
jgi:hypothetical protein